MSQVSEIHSSDLSLTAEGVVVEIFTQVVVIATWLHLAVYLDVA
jgi:hypothetical protein